MLYNRKQGFQSYLGLTSHDSEEQPVGPSLPNGTIDNSSSDLELGFEGGDAQVVGLHYTNIRVPYGSLVTDSALQFTTDEVDTGATTLRIYADKQPNSSAPSLNLFDLSGRTPTDNEVSWSPDAWNLVDERSDKQKTPDLSPVLNELAAQLTWDEGNSVTLLVDGTGERTAYSRDDDTNDDPDNPRNSAALSYSVSPLAVITSPSKDMEFVLAGVPQTLAANPKVLVDIVDAKFFVNGTLVFTDTAAPFEYEYSFAAGVHDLFVDFSYADGSKVRTMRRTIRSGDKLLRFTLAGGNSDSEENTGDSDAPYIDNNDIDFGQDTNVPTAKRLGFFHFNNVKLSAGDTIVSSHMKFVSAEASEEPTFLTVHGDAVDDSSLPSTNVGDLANRVKTTASTYWVPGLWEAAGVVVYSPDISNVLSEILNRGGWASGNAMGFIISGFGKRSVLSCDELRKINQGCSVLEVVIDE